MGKMWKYLEPRGNFNEIIDEKLEEIVKRFITETFREIKNHESGILIVSIFVNLKICLMKILIKVV